MDFLRQRAWSWFLAIGEKWQIDTACGLIPCLQYQVIYPVSIRGEFEFYFRVFNTVSLYRNNSVSTMSFIPCHLLLFYLISSQRNNEISSNLYWFKWETTRERAVVFDMYCQVQMYQVQIIVISINWNWHGMKDIRQSNNNSVSSYWHRIREDKMTR